MTTLHDKLCMGLRNIGAVPIPKKNKYTMFRRVRDNGVTVFYFVGSNGALRVSKRPNAASSVPVSDQFKLRVMAQDTLLI